MGNKRELILKVLAGTIVFAAFMLLLSPVYVYRSILLELTYSAAAKTSLNVGCARHVLPSPKHPFVNTEKYDLTAAEKPKTVFLELPCPNRVTCIVVSFPDMPGTFHLQKASILRHGEKYPLSLKKTFVNSRDQKRLKYSDEAMLIKPGEKMVIRFLFDKMLKIHCSVDFAALMYSVLIALFPALLVFKKSRFRVESGEDVIHLLYSAAALLFLVSPVLLIDYFGTLTEENRFKNKFPDLFEHQRFNVSFAKQFEAWLADRFAGRSSAIRTEKRIFSPSFGPAAGGKVIAGKEHWFFTKEWNSVAMYQNKNRFTERQLAVCAENLKQMNDFFQKRNIRFYVMLVPDKERVCSEFYPDFYKQVHPESRIEQLAGYLETHTQIRLIFPLKQLREAQKEHLTYFKTGTHWTFRGAGIGVSMLLQQMKKDFPALPMEQPNAERWKKTLCADVDLAKAAGYSDPLKQLPREELAYDEPETSARYGERNLEDAFGDLNLSEYTAENPLPGSLRVFVCTDSFWIYAKRFMFPATHTMLHAYFGNGADFELQLIRKKIEDFHPDAVVLESAERFLDRFLTINMGEE